MKLSVLVAVPPEVVTTIWPLLVPLPTVAVIVESSTTVNEAAGLPANVGEVAPVKCVPLTVTERADG